MKKINRIKLINWHYFVNETLNIKGSFLLAGENKSGKSTILDAIQYILTANSRNFNKSANENSKRDLKGYVRCKTGVDGKEYLRTGSITSYIAIEFFDDNTCNYFVIGAKIDSPDEDSTLDVKWFILDNALDDITFMVGNRPAMDSEFRVNDKKIITIRTQTEMKSQIMRRLGNVNARFFELIPQSIAFKPMNNVKEFINRFILQEHKIDIKNLLSNIQHLDELNELMEKVSTQINQLNDILKVKDKISDIKDNILIYKIMIEMANLERLHQELNQLNLMYTNLKQQISLINNNIQTLNIDRNNALNKLKTLEYSLNSSDNSRLISDCKYNLQRCTDKLTNLTPIYNNFLNRIKDLKNILPKLRISFNINELLSKDITIEDKISMCNRLSTTIEHLKEDYTNRKYDIKTKLTVNRENINRIQQEINLLKDKKLSYPEDTTKLKRLIEQEFQNRHIVSDVYIFCDTLEIIDNVWQNAIEGYLNFKRFFILVEPKYYDIALMVYNRYKNEISTVGLINLEKLSLNISSNKDSLSNYVVSQNRYSKAYADYLLNDVIRCDEISNLKNHLISITKDCILYKDYAITKINHKFYDLPYIGVSAINKQLEIKQLEYSNLNNEKDTLENQLKKVNSILFLINKLKIDDISNNVNIIEDYSKAKDELSNAQVQYNEALQNPNYLELIDRKTQAERIYKQLDNQYNEATIKSGKSQSNIERLSNDIASCNEKIKYQTTIYDNLVKDNSLIEDDAIRKYNRLKQGKTIDIMINNFNNNRYSYERDLKNVERELINLQYKFDGGNLGIGYDNIQYYIDEKNKLEHSELIKYKDDLVQARQTCESIFHQDFLAKLKEQIENAQQSFKELNKSLKDIYYGEDNYYFKLSKNKNKEAIYEMIMSQNNIQHDTDTLFSIEFENEHKQEIDELFSRLTASSDMNDKAIQEYTDYRSYLDYDIKITNKHGDIKWFSKIYANMSGGEAQTPYYVAIASSFLQLYSSNSIRIIILDEAFDKMDDDRIQSMMKFFNDMNFQIILGTPPAKIEVIGEFVDEVLMVMRIGNSSIVEEYIL